MRASLCLCASVAVLLSSSFAPAQETDERAQLVQRKEQLEKRVAKLRQEQDLLLFQKQMYESDSKYLLLDLAKGTATLKYRERVLRTISFTPQRSRAARLLAGKAVLTARQDGQEWRRSLAFGDRLLLAAGKAGSPAPAGGPLRIRLSKGDMATLFYTLDIGSQVYVLR